MIQQSHDPDPSVCEVAGAWRGKWSQWPVVHQKEAWVERDEEEEEGEGEVGEEAIESKQSERMQLVGTKSKSWRNEMLMRKTDEWECEFSHHRQENHWDWHRPTEEAKSTDTDKGGEFLQVLGSHLYDTVKFKGQKAPAALVDS